LPIPAPAPAPLALLSDYHPVPGGWDECLWPAGTIRDHWRDTLIGLNALGHNGIEDRWQDGERALRDNGVTYAIVGEGSDGRPWNVDRIPLVIGEDEWGFIQTGIIQRARLLEELLHDCYGPRRLLADGTLSPGSVFAHPGYLRPCLSVPPGGGHHLHLLAIDLLRTENGQWMVTNHRCQSPTGLGYALENRVVLNRAFPRVFNSSRVLRLAGFFSDLLQHLRSVAPRNRDNPRIVVLTPPPPHPSSFENAYLARYLDLPLVRGEDLTVRSDGVFLKTLDDLVPVDVILRRVDDHSADPLELDSAGKAGTAGLLHAARREQVAIVNPFGCSLAENAVWLGNAESLCQRVLGEDLTMPSAETRWAADDVDGLCKDISRYVIKRAFRVGERSPMHGGSLNPEQRARLVAEIRATPHAFVGQIHHDASTMPCWSPSGLVPRPVVMRAFAVRNGTGWSVMPGGLARVAGNEKHAFAMQRGGVAKDLWVTTAGTIPRTSLLTSARAELPVIRGSGQVTSRVGDHLYWFGRYAERAEASARLARAILVCQESENGNADVLLRALPVLRRAVANHSNRLNALVADGNCIDSVRQLLTELQRTALTARDRLSDDTWRMVNRLLTMVPDQLGDGAVTVLDDIVAGLVSIAGFAKENTVHGPAWLFLELGRRIERANHICALVPALLDSAGDDETLPELLRLADSMITYRSRYLTHLQRSAVLDLLLLDPGNPRGLRFQLDAILTALSKLPTGATTPPPRASLDRLIALFTSTEAGAITDPGALLADTTITLQGLADELGSRYLSHTAMSRQLGRTSEWST
jgi:uncharacterized circularly permuted ATP-grasp superfamily protein/uncharacterized alpha-E superfamily protein